LFSSFRDVVGKVEGYNSRAARAMPAPSWCELLYDNLIPLGLDGGTKLTMGEVLQPVQFEPSRPRAGFLMTWWESIEDRPDIPNLQVTANGVTVPLPEGGSVKSYVKLQFVARSAVVAWEEVFVFLSRAHDKLRLRLVELTTEKCRQSWGPQ
jgi:hypothetical protein